MKQRWRPGSCAATALVVAVLTVEVSGQLSGVPSEVPSSEQVIAILSQTIDWYRNRMIERQIATDPSDFVFVEDNRPVAAQIVRLSFDFARARASLPSTPTPSNQLGSSFASPELAHFIQQQTKIQQEIVETTQELEAVKTKLSKPRGLDRQKLQATLDATQTRLDLLQAGLASLQEVIDFVREPVGRRGGDLQASIDDLARTVPELANPAGAQFQAHNPDITAAAKLKPSGILGLLSEVSAHSAKLRILNDQISRTDKLRQSANDIRTPTLSYLYKQLPSSTENELTDSDLPSLQHRKAQFDALRLTVKALSPAVVALDKQTVLLADYSSRLKSWRAKVIDEDEKTWQELTLRVAGMVVGIAVLALIGTFARKVTDRHIRDAERRHVTRVTVRVVLWCTIVLVIGLSFASDLTSFATFFGLVTAGLAVALQSVILSALGYLILVGRRGIMVGDRVQISGVTGDVMEITWLQFRVSEIDTRTQQPTGNVVTFSNAFVLPSPATGLSKMNRSDLNPAQIEASAKAPHA